MARLVPKILLFATLFTNVYLTNAKVSQSSLNNLQESLDQLIIFKKGGGQDIEITARQAAFNRVMDLAIEELIGLKKRLEKTSGADRSKYLSTVAEYQAYHELIRDQINRDISLDELIDIVTKFKKWHETIYNKEIAKVISFITTFQGQEAAKTAENRLDRIVRDFDLIKSYLMPNEWALAEKLIDDARDFIKEGKITAAYKNFITLSEMVK